MKPINGIVEGLFFKGNITHACTASSALYKCKTKHCMVIIVDITEGTITRGENINVCINGKSVKDTVTRIEKNKKEVTFAKQGEGVGICLFESNIDEFPSTPTKT